MLHIAASGSKNWNKDVVLALFRREHCEWGRPLTVRLFFSQPVLRSCDEDGFGAKQNRSAAQSLNASVDPTRRAGRCPSSNKAVLRVVQLQSPRLAEP